MRQSFRLQTDRADWQPSRGPPSDVPGPPRVRRDVPWNLTRVIAAGQKPVLGPARGFPFRFFNDSHGHEGRQFALVPISIRDRQGGDWTTRNIADRSVKTVSLSS